MLNIIVCIKQVPDTRQVRINPETGNLIREGVPSIVNPDDKHAVEAAISLKEKCGGKTIVMTMGPAQAEEALRECLAMGIDEAILLSDRAFAGADTSATSYTLGCAIKKLGTFDIILCGRQAIDGNTAQVGPQLAGFLGIPQVTYVRSIEIKDDILRVSRALEDGYEVVELKMPALLTTIKDLNIPRIPPVDAVMEAYREKSVIIWTANDIKADLNKIGLKGSPTRIRKVSTTPQKNREVEIIEGTYESMVETLITRLKSKEYI
jgi:electron transfer flavoprotein beta subunit